MVTARTRRRKWIEPQLDVLLDLHGELVLVGSLALDEDAGNFHARFQYAASYLERASLQRAFPLDPKNLPLSPEPFDTSSRYFKLGALFDAAPDAWGRTVMAKDEDISPLALSESKVLLKGKGSGVGAILFAPAGSYQPGSAAPAVGQGLPALSDLEQINTTIAALESGAQVDEDLRALLMSSWDMGGARPKAVVVDEHGGEWIAKFPRSIDTYSRQRNEWANLEMARTLGMRVPMTRLVELTGGDCVLLIKRFDRDATGLHRQHYLSAVSLISPPADFDKRQMDTPYGASIFSYARIADTIRAISAHPVHDTAELFGRMILNIVLHNTDDHLKNTGFLMEPDSFKYRLSPLFDVVTQEGNQKHMLHMGPGIEHPRPSANGRIGNLENARAGASHWGLKDRVADELIQQVCGVVAQHRDFYRAAGMNETEIERVERWVIAAA